MYLKNFNICVSFNFFLGGGRYGCFTMCQFLLYGKVNQLHGHTYPSPDLLPHPPSNPPRSSRRAELSKLCSRAGSHQLSVSHVVVDLCCLPGGSAGEESACSTRDPGLSPGLGNSPGEGNGYPLQYSWVSLVAQRVKNPPAVWENWLPSLEGGIASHSSIFFPGETPWTEEPHGLKCTGSHRHD